MATGNLVGNRKIRPCTAGVGAVAFVTPNKRPPHDHQTVCGQAGTAIFHDTDRIAAL